MAVVTVDPCYVRTAPHRPSAAVYARRRLVAGLLLVLVLAAACLAAGRATAALVDDPASVHGRRLAPAAVTGPFAADAVVVERGDTLWTIARRLQPDGDVRPLVRALRLANGGTALQAGTRLVLP